MTFGIGFAGLDYVGVVSDRRVSGGPVPDDESGKSGVVEFSDGLFAYTYAGLAEVPVRGFRSREFIAQMLMQSGEGGAPSATALDSFADRAQAQMNYLVNPSDGTLPVPRVHTATGYVFAGYARNGDVMTRRLAYINNYESLFGTVMSALDMFQSATLEVPEGEAVKSLGVV